MKASREMVKTLILISTSVEEADKVIEENYDFKTFDEKIAFLQGMFDVKVIDVHDADGNLIRWPIFLCLAPFSWHTGSKYKNSNELKLAKEVFRFYSKYLFSFKWVNLTHMTVMLLGVRKKAKKWLYNYKKVRWTNRP